MNMCWVWFRFQGCSNGVPQARYANSGSSVASDGNTCASATRTRSCALWISGLLARASASISARVIVLPCAMASRANRTNEYISPPFQFRKRAREDGSDSQDVNGVDCKESRRTCWELLKSMFSETYLRQEIF